MSMILDGSNGVTFNDSSLQGAAASPYGLKNRIINGDMRIDQRNAGASVTPATNQYLVDRFMVQVSQSSKFTAQQNAGSVTPPTGFTNYLGCTSSSAYTVGSSDYFSLQHRIEGYNIADLAWGTANAKTITLSFWVRSSLTGTFGGAINNADNTRAYPFSYTISSANTWEQKTITIAGDTSGTWLTTNGIGLIIYWSLGTGSTYSGTAGSWSGTTYLSATGATNVVATNGATFYITGVQLEIGSTATPFERRMYGQELALCQRYYFKDFPNTNYSPFGTGSLYNGTNAQIVYKFPVPMRALATMAISGILVQAGTTNTSNISTINNTYQGLNAALLEVTVSGFSGAQGCWWSTGGNGTTAFVSGSAEL